ncbi:MAG: hypothetical protein PHF84_00405 [bacterium]|nr:hypothetical protein [bacterium]
MKKKTILIFLLLFFPLISSGQNLLKFYSPDKKIIRLGFRPEKELQFSLVLMANGPLYTEKTIGKSVIRGKRIERNLWARLLRKQARYRYDLPLSHLDRGFYRLILSGTTWNTNILLLISRYKLVTRLLNDQASSYLVDTVTDIPVSGYDLFIRKGEYLLPLPRNSGYFYDCSLEKADYVLTAVYSNQMDLLSIREDQIHPRRPEPYTEIIFPKEYFYIGENLLYVILLKEREFFDYYNRSLSEVEISILNSNSLPVKSKKFRNIETGYVSDSFVLDDSFSDGLYYLEVKGLDFSRRRPFVLLKKNFPEYEIKVSTEKDVYYTDEPVEVTASIACRYGPPLRQGDVFCDVFLRELNSTGNFRYLYTLKKRAGSGKVRFKIKKLSAARTGNYELKFVIKARGNNGLKEANYRMIKILQADYDMRITTSRNLFEVENPLTLNYELIRLNDRDRPRSLTLKLYRILDMKGGKSKLIRTFSLDPDKNEITFRLNKTGYYRASFLLLDKNNNKVQTSSSFWVLSYIYGIEPPSHLDDIVIIQDKKEYVYSDIGKLLIIFPFKKGWYNLIFEGIRFFHNTMNFTEKNFTIFDFPVDEQYSPEVFAYVSIHQRNKLISRKTIIRVPYYNKFLKVNTVISNRSDHTNFHRISIKPVNYWNHELKAAVLFFTLNRNYMELYNQDIYPLYDKLYLSLEDRMIFPGQLIKKTAPPAEEPQKFDLLYSDYLINSLYNYELFSTSKGVPLVSEFVLKNFGSWNVVLWGFTDDTKLGLNRIPQNYTAEYQLSYRVPAYLFLRDQAFIPFMVRNNRKIDVKSRFVFTIINGKYRSESRRYAGLPALGSKKILVSFKPLYPGTAKIEWDAIMPDQSQKESLYTRIIPEPAMSKKNNRSLKIKKSYYRLKYISEGENYYSKLKRAGSSFNPGDDIIVHLRINSKKDLSNIKIVDYIPAGFEYVENYQDYHLYKIKPNLNYGVIRQEEKLVFPIPELKKGHYNIYFILKAKLSGRYYRPGFFVLQGEKLMLSFPEDDFFTIR